MSDIRNWKKIVENATKVVENDAEDVNHTDHEVSMAKSQLCLLYTSPSPRDCQ